LKKKYYKHVGHIVHFFSTEESISIQRKNKSLFDINKTIGNIQSKSWTLNKDMAKRLAALERKALRRMSGGIKVYENWRKPYNK